jgi:hypothetical protein
VIIGTITVAAVFSIRKTRRDEARHAAPAQHTHADEAPSR